MEKNKKNSSEADKIESIYRKIADNMIQTLENCNFTKTEDEFYPGLFGTRHILMVRDKQVVKFIWDGKENCFRLLYCPQLNSFGKSQWQEIFVYEFTPDSPETLAAGEILEQLTDFFREL